jgi:GNAT superfamily N-acetyltransferase
VQARVIGVRKDPAQAQKWESWGGWTRYRHSPVNEIALRPGTPDDFPALLQMFDDAVAWLTARGSAGQWGTEPWSGIPLQVERVREMAGSNRLQVAEVDGVPAGVSITQGTCPRHVPSSGEPEIYLGLLLISRRFGRLGVGGRLIANVFDEARQSGVGLVRVDCWAGGDGNLVRYYESQGFTRTVQFEVEVRNAPWIGQVFELRLD